MVGKQVIVEYIKIAFLSIVPISAMLGLIRVVRHFAKHREEAVYFSIVVIGLLILFLPPFFFSPLGASLWMFGAFFLVFGRHMVVDYWKTRSERTLGGIIVLFLVCVFISILTFVGRSGYYDPSQPIAASFVSPKNQLPMALENTKVQHVRARALALFATDTNANTEIITLKNNVKEKGDDQNR